MGIKKDVMMLRDLLCFAETAKEGQVNEAARKNGMKQSNMSKVIKDLERGLDTKLFNRVHQGMRLTETGREVFEISCGIEHILYQIRNFSAFAHQVSGDLRLWTSDGIGAAYISACLPGFYAQYPDVHLEIQYSLETPQTIHDIDMAIVYEKPTQTDAVVIYENALRFRLYASKLYLARYGVPQTLDDLAENHKICTRSNFIRWPEWSKFLNKAKHIAATTNSSQMLLSIIKEGVGVGLIPTCIAQKEPDLFELKKIGFEIEHPFWVISHKDTKDLPKVRALLDYIRSATGKL